MNTIQDWINYHAEHRPTQIFLCQPDGIQIDYAALSQHCASIEVWLLQQDIGRGEKVAFLLDNSAATALLFLGVMAAGRVIVPLNATASPAQLAYVIAHSDAKVVLFSEVYQARLAHSAVLTGDALKVSGLLHALEVAWQCIPLTSAATAPPADTQVTGDTPALLIYTSGTTGQPKGVLLSQRNVIAGGQNTVAAHQLDAQDRALCVLPLYHINGEIVTVIAPLLSGGSVVMPSGFDVTQFWHWIHAYDCTWFSVVPTLINHLLAAATPDLAATPKLRFGRSASAPLPPSVHRAFEQRFGIKIIETMGLTETAAPILSNPLDRNRYGSPGMAYGNAAKIVDPDGAELPLGQVGEILIRGDNVMLGYYKAPDLTAQALTADGWLHTGDLAYCDSDGFFFIRGRLKELIIRGGENIAPREIDEVLYQHPAVLEAAAFAVEHELYGQEVAAAVVLKANHSATVSELLDFCDSHLGSVKAPKCLVIATRLPKGPAGKILRLQLSQHFTPPETSDAANSPTAAVGSELEQRLLAQWQAVLAAPQLGVNDNFFRSGGDSIRAALLVNRLNADLGMTLHPVQIFEHPSVAKLAAWLHQHAGSSAAAAIPRLPRQPGENGWPLSFAQRRLWFLLALEPAATAAYQITVRLEVRGKLDPAAWHAAWQTLVQRQDSLRTTIELRDGAPVQCIGTAQSRWCQFDLRPQDADTWQVDIRLHHLISDGWSIRLLIEELLHCPTQPLRIQYADYAAWQQAQLDPAHLDYWRSQLANSPPGLDLPADHPRPPQQTYQGATQDIVFSAALTAKLNAFAQQHDSTLFALLFSAFAVLLYRYSGQDDLLIGTPLANRNHAELEALIGLFVNNLPLRVQCDATLRFSELLAQVQHTFQAALRHQDTPFEQIVEALAPPRDLSRNPLFQTFFILHNPLPARFETPDFSITPLPRHSQTAKFDVTLAIEPRHDGEETVLRGYFEYSTALFSAARMARMAAHFVYLLDNALNAPDTLIARLPLVTPGEIQQYSDWNAASTMLAPMITLPQWFQAQAARTPDALAVISAELSASAIAPRRNTTYGQLNQRANQLAQRLLSLGVQAEDTVAVYLPRDADLIAALLAVLKCGACYVPLDPAYPRQRLSFMLDDAAVKVAITDPTLRADLPPELAICDVSDPELAALPSTNPPPVARTEMPAYLIYTSGSTGQPKGVQVPHRALINFLLSMQTTLQLTPADSWLAVTTVAFDIAALELFLPLINGASIVLASREIAQDGRWLRSLLSEATVMQATPATWRMVLAAPPTTTAKLPKLLCGGEALPVELAAALVQLADRAWNLYGPTETTIWSTLYPLSAELNAHANHTTPIGKPLGNTQLYVLDKHQQPVPLGVPGELYIGGKGVALGYLNRSELTAERFVHFGSECLYRTGDAVRWREDGNLEYLERLDLQVKLRGFRIELGEIESLLATHPALQQAVVVVRDERLLAYIQSDPAAPTVPAAAELQAWLRHRLPDYMIPALFIELATFPLTPNAKVDRKALPAPNLPSAAAAPPATATEQQLAELWAALLGVTPGRTDDFFRLGGHSLLALQLLTRIEQHFGTSLPLRALFAHSSLADLARQLDRTHFADGCLVPLNQATTSDAPLFWVHPIGGTVFCYRELAQPLTRPVFGLQAEGDDTTLPAIAARYVAAIRAQQAHGPYQLAGWSLGGVIALAMAQHLAAQGETCTLLVVDARLSAPDWDAATLQQRFREDAGALGLDSPQFTTFTRLYHAWRNYQPQPYSGELRLLCAESCQAEDWLALAPTATVEHLNCGHYEVLAQVVL